MIVIDCSALVHALIDKGSRGEAVRDKIATDDLAAPGLLDYEIASALFGMARGTRSGTPKLERPALDEALDTYQALTIRRYDALPFWPRVRILSANLSPYDAPYTALAEALGTTLVTADARIKRSGAARCPVEVI
ncbi:type II toxin-antitoxin system VapC family toxin [Streptomyces sp. DG2A-72]|uniref:type II toxin-antitoxin system VapC family toxin n=1 Tax=Streptomyces sp. DG2A-72 TaxID=3051386 RepID=UPI00265C6ADE|nr:type II toxin-antitoxin system VapC family toxin [Streptomyces sp. DG2A-72]MDO0937371.1 type II toxin-antitoxin system VapC family toxin [Streptomyces sp. DG2A-72]